MIIQLVLTAGLLVGCIYFYLGGIGNWRFGLVVYAMLAGGAVMVWDPDIADGLARIVGVGRGADLVFYCWVLLSFVVVVNLHLRQRDTDQLIVQLVRHQAISNPMLPGGETEPVRPQDGAIQGHTG